MARNFAQYKGMYNPGLFHSPKFSTFQYAGSRTGNFQERDSEGLRTWWVPGCAGSGNTGAISPGKMEKQGLQQWVRRLVWDAVG